MLSSHGVLLRVTMMLDHQRIDTRMTILAVGASHATTRYSLRIATDGAEVRAAQRLRHQVFAGELGARLHTDTPDHDIDEFDGYCDHLIVVEESTQNVVGTYRMLPPDQAGAAGGLYSESEFDLVRLGPLRETLVEVGRSCVHPAHRNGAVIGLMWAGMARYLHLAGYQWLGGCSSVPLIDGGATAARVWQAVSARHLSPPTLRVTPLQPWPVDGVPAAGAAAFPPLLRGYLRLGAWVCGPPAHDQDFAVADFFVLLSLERIDPRYIRHFLGTSG